MCSSSKGQDVVYWGSFQQKISAHMGKVQKLNQLRDCLALRFSHILIRVFQLRVAAALVLVVRCGRRRLQQVDNSRADQLDSSRPDKELTRHGL